jgi:chromosome segregation ATPase
MHTELEKKFQNELSNRVEEILEERKVPYEMNDAKSDSLWAAVNKLNAAVLSMEGRINATQHSVQSFTVRTSKRLAESDKSVTITMQAAVNRFESLAEASGALPALQKTVADVESTVAEVNEFKRSLRVLETELRESKAGVERKLAESSDSMAATVTSELPGLQKTVADLRESLQSLEGDMKEQLRSHGEELKESKAGVERTLAEASEAHTAVASELPGLQKTVADLRESLQSLEGELRSHGEELTETLGSLETGVRESKDQLRDHGDALKETKEGIERKLVDASDAHAAALENLVVSHAEISKSVAATHQSLGTLEEFSAQSQQKFNQLEGSQLVRGYCPLQRSVTDRVLLRIGLRRFCARFRTLWTAATAIALTTQQRCSAVGYGAGRAR